LDDEDHDTPQFNTVSVEKKMIIEEEEIKTEIKFFDKEDDTSNAPEQAWRNEEETEQEYSLFSIDEEGEDPNDLEIQSFSFDFENKKEEPQSGTPVSKSFSEEKPVEFNFFVNEPTRNESKSDFGQPKAEFNAPASAVAEPAQKMETFYQKQEEPKAEVKPAFETKKEIETPKTEESEFTFVNKTVDQDRVVERRNKLKEFNSRYQSFDSMSEFESIPAFKRKNISIDGTNASDQNINTYLSDNNGSMQIRENRFLNKDVD
ncbi:MAG TPA: cell division protein FtsZ, partial [Chryseobacterium indologenes]|nr:cell division protein FtsZ [Chryseobacterium indologenes]